MTLNRADSSKISAEDRQRVLQHYGIADAKPLAVGTEAEVYDYGAGQVLKLYADVSRQLHFETLRDFYDRLDTSATTLALPKIEAIDRHDNLIALVEQRVPGVPLADKLDDLHAAEQDRVETLYLDAVFQLRRIVLKKPPKTYLLFDQSQHSLVARQSFNHYYADFLEQKIAQVGRYFASADASFPEKARVVVEAVRSGETIELSIVHGDFFPGNVLVDEGANRVHGVVDFGSFTLFGSYLLDVAGAFGFYQMYDLLRIANRRRMLPKILQRLTPAEQAIFFQYLLAHAILTSDLYAPTPDPRGDGHFQWAAEIVADDVYWRGALGERILGKI